MGDDIDPVITEFARAMARIHRKLDLEKSTSHDYIEGCYRTIEQYPPDTDWFVMLPGRAPASITLDEYRAMVEALPQEVTK